MRKCLVSNGIHLCEQPEGHEGWHTCTVGAGSCAWGTSYPRWVHVSGLGEYNDRYAQPGEPLYEESLERLRELIG